MKSDLHKLVYYSRNCIAASPEQTVAEINQILASARVNNSRENITGALFFNSQIFAQALEGPLQAIEKTFERIQRDPRHSDVIVLQSGEAAARDFPEWTMAFAGQTPGESFAAAEKFNPDFSNSSVLGEQVLSMLRELVTQEDFWA